jgi:hypothetical protein
MPASTAMATRADITVFMIILLDCIYVRVAVQAVPPTEGDFAACDARVTRSLCTIE